MLGAISCLLHHLLNLINSIVHGNMGLNSIDFFDFNVFFLLFHASILKPDFYLSFCELNAV